MLPLENLDKKLFKEILEQSRSNIHKFTNEWTDENYHDPGITFLDMFSWLTEMQRYYLNIVTHRNKQKFFKLYDIELEKQGFADTYVSFPSVKNVKCIPSGMKLKAEEQVFQTEKMIHIHNNELSKIFTVSEGKMIDNTHYNNPQNNVCYHIFGKQVDRRNRVYIGFKDKIKINTELDLMIKIKDDYPIHTSGVNIYDYGVKGEWFIFTENKKWKRISCKDDTTECFTKTGVITLEIDDDMTKTVIGTDNENYFWVMFEVTDTVAQLPPEIEYVKINTVKVINKNEVVKCRSLPSMKREVELDDFLSIYGENILQFKRDDYWFDVDEEQYSIENIEGGRIKLVIKPTYEEVRLISYDDAYTHMPVVGSGNGLPNQVIQTKLDDVVPELLVMQIGSIKDGIMAWKDLRYVHDFIESNCLEACFTMDLEHNHIIFGNGECGVIPDKGENNIRFINYVSSNRERGNVKQYEIDEFVTAPLEWSYMKFYNEDSATGGKKAADIESGKESVIKDYKKIYRAVTSEDYEGIIKSIPGIRIALSKAIVDSEDRNRISIVAIPYTGEKKPLPDAKLMRILYKYIQKYRLITTQVKIIKPIYVDIYVKCILAVNKIDEFDLEQLKSNILKSLNPIKGTEVNKEYKIGSTIYVSEIMKLITQHEGVNYVKRLWLDAEEIDIKKDDKGNIFIPQNGIICCENVFIDLIE